MATDIMAKLGELVPEVIKAIGDSTVGLLALIVILVTAIGYAFLKDASVPIRFLVFFLMFLGAVAFGVAVSQGMAREVPLIPEQRSELVWSTRHFCTGENVHWGGPEAPDCDCLHVGDNTVRFKPVWAEYIIPFCSPGKYRIFVTYASATSRPMTLVWNAQTIATNAMMETTGGWQNLHMKLEDQKIEVNAIRGPNTFRIERGDHIPHIRSFKFAPVK